jgi:hypothetical protein
MAADGVKQYCSSTSACWADMSGSGRDSGSQHIEEHVLKGEDAGVDMGDDSTEGLAVLETELWRECRGEDRGERGEGGVFISVSRPSKAMASVRKWADEQASDVRA